MGSRSLLRVEKLNKRFPQVWANRDISLELDKGEIHCLLGENGAGKTTLAECLYGSYRPDSGTVWFNGSPLILSSPRDAIRAGIGMVHQHFVLASPLSVMENVIVGTSRRFLLDLRGAERKLSDLCRNYGLALDLSAPISHLSVGEQQWVEILKALYVGIDLLILDEPTAVLTPMETDSLFQILNKMKSEGLTVIFITHKLNEVMAISDRVSVLRKGELIATERTADVTKRELARMMVGRDVRFQLDKQPVVAGPPVLEVQSLQAHGDRGQDVLRGLSFMVRRGEILGVAGVSGNGQRELFEVLTGMRKATAGHVFLEGEDVTNRPPRYIMQGGVAAIPEDRIGEGLIMDFRIEENMVLGLHHSRRFSRWRFLNNPEIERFTAESIRRFDITGSSHRQATRVLSGGNLQKVILARELSQRPRCLIASQPTRGLDVAATEYVRGRLLAERENGTAILLFSEDLDEIFILADCIAVMFHGRIVGVIDASVASLERVALLMAGISGQATQDEA